jgi:hypothetical protein
MREWHITREQLPSVILAADARMSPLNFYDDQIWELHLDSGEPAALSLQTTYGLRALGMRVFPRFTEGDDSRTSPRRFATPPALHRFYPNYTLATFSPYEGIDVVAEYWVPRSNMIAGRLRVINSGVIPRELQLELVALLAQAGEGQQMTPHRFELSDVLKGRTNKLSPVIFMTGGAVARHSPYPSLGLSFELLPGLDKSVTWVQAALPDTEGSYSLAREMARVDWDAEIARIEMTNASVLEISTGDPKWDLAFHLGQRTAFSLLHGPTEHLPNRSFVTSRQPDQGFSLRGDGSDYDHTWSGQSPLDTYYLIQHILLASPELAQDLVENMLATQDEDGQVDWRASLTGSRSGLLATPLLAQLAWKIYETSQDREFLERIFVPLRRYFDHWFRPEHDRDGNGVPEFDNVSQTGFEDNPIFTPWQTWSQGAEISIFENPALMAMMFSESASLLKIARALSRTTPMADWTKIQERMRLALNRAWDNRTGTYAYLDRDTHAGSAGSSLANQLGAGTIPLAGFQFEDPVRLLIRIHQTGERGRRPEIVIHGVDAQGTISSEMITPSQFRWSLGLGSAVSAQVYTSFSRIEVDGIHAADRITIQTVDYGHHDQSLFLPLWAGIPEQERADELVRRHLMRPTRYWQSYGLAACAVNQCPSPDASSFYETVWMPWNSLIGIGMVRYGYRELAAELVSRLMDAIVTNLKNQGSFPKHHHAKTGQASGERNALGGLPPVELFLETLGVRIISPFKVALEGSNPFPWPVQIHYRGLHIHRGADRTEVAFPDGQSLTIEDPEPCLIDSRPGEARVLR